MKRNDKIHLNGYPNIRGKIIKANKWGIVVLWDDGKQTRNDTQVLCQCTDGICQHK